MRIAIAFTPTYCTIQNSISLELSQDLYNFLAYRPTGYFFSPAYQSRTWDGYTRLYNFERRKFRSGLLSRTIEFLENGGCTVDITGLPVEKLYVQHSNTYTLRPYQEKIVQEIVRTRFGLIQAPPRTGKTLCVIGTVDSEREFPAIFLCRSLDLAYQTVDKFKEFLPDVSVGLIGDGKVDIQEVTIVTIQSAYSAYSKKFPEKVAYVEKEIADKGAARKLIQSAKQIFFDESHHSSSSTSRFILDRNTICTLKIGLSATPFAGKEEDLLLESIFGPVIHYVSYSELIKEGFLLRPTIYMYKLPKMSIDGNYQAVYKQAVTENSFLNSLVKKIVDALIGKKKSVVVQTEFISHTKKIAELLNAPALTGKDKAEYRKEVLDKLRKKEVLCVVSTLLEEGIDVPSLDYTINLAGGLSSIGTLQRMRSITAIEGKITCGIIDFEHHCKYLKRHSSIRKKLYAAESEFELILRDANSLTKEGS